MSIKPSDVLFYAGGAALELYGTISRRTTVIARRGEQIIETCTRNLAAKYVGGDGLLRTAAVNLPRVNHWADGAVLPTPLLLLEEERKNSILQSEDLSTTWTISGLTLGLNTEVAPDGVQSADRVIENSSPGTHYITQTVTVTDGVDFAFSIFAKAGTSYDWISLVQISGGNLFECYFNINTGAVGSNATSGNGVLTRAYVEEFPNDWYRCTVVGTLGSGVTSAICRPYIANANGQRSFTGDGSSYTMLWGGQAEVWALGDVDFSSSYIRTTTATVTRGEDDMSFPFWTLPQAKMGYLKFRERGSILTTSCGLWQIGSNVVPLLRVRNASDYYRVDHWNGDGAALRSATMGTRPVLGDTVELAWGLSAEGAVSLWQSINGAATTAATPSTGIPLADAWSDEVCTINSYVGGDSAGFNEYEAVIVVRGSYSNPIKQFRRLLP